MGTPPPPPTAGGPPPAAPPPPADGPPPPADAKPAAGPPRPTIDPATKYRELGTIKILAAMYMFICMALNIVFIIYNPATSEMLPENLGTIGGLAAMVVTIVSVVFGIMAIFMALPMKIGPYTLRVIMMLLSPLFMVVGAAIKPTIMTVGPVDVIDLALAIVFGVFFILFIEYLHAVWRFTQIGQMAIERNLKDFDFGHVIRHYMGFGGAILGVIVVISLVVVFMREGFLGMMAENAPQFASSVEMNSVYGLAISSAIFFAIIGIVLSFWFGGRDYAASMKAVRAFSKEKLRQMSDESSASGSPSLKATMVDVPKQ